MEAQDVESQQVKSCGSVVASGGEDIDFHYFSYAGALLHLKGRREMK